MTILEKLEVFLTRDTSRNVWLEDDQMKVYVRKSRRILGGHCVYCLDIASVEVSKEHQRKGLFTHFLHGAEKLNPFEYIFIENVLNPVLLPMIKREWWIAHEHLPLCFYKRRTTQCSETTSSTA